MYLTNRQHALLRKISSKGVLAVDELRNLLPVSRETLRKELKKLEELGLVERSYGLIRFVESPQNQELLRDIGFLTKEQRRKRIHDFLLHHRELRINSLAAKMNVSTLTIRNDVAEMEREGLVVKKHGSVVLLQGAEGSDVRAEGDAFDHKTKTIGQHSMVHINPGDKIFLDGGSVSAYLATTLPLHSDIPVMTNSLEVVRILMKRRYTSAIQIVPGKINLDNGMVAVENARSFFAAQAIDKAFLSLSSYANHVFYMETEEDVPTAAEVCEYAAKVYLILNSAMIDKRGSHAFPYETWTKKIQEILVDDGLSRSEANLLFAKRDPVVIYGPDSAFRNLNRRKYRVGFLVNKDRNFFIQAVYNSLLEAAGKHLSVAMSIRECDGDYESTIHNFNLLLEDKVDLLIDFSLCMESMIYLDEKCRLQGVKLIGVDLRLPGSVYFGSDNALAGTIAGEHAAEYIKKHWHGSLDRIIILSKYGMDPITNLRVMSTVQRVKAEVSCARDEVATTEWGHPVKNPTQELMGMLKDIPKEERLLFIAFNLRHLLAAHEIIAQHRTPDRTIMVGQNYNQQIAEMMAQENSPIIGCVHYNPEEYGDRIMKLAIRMLEGQPVEPMNYTTHTWIPNKRDNRI